MLSIANRTTENYAQPSSSEYGFRYSGWTTEGQCQQHYQRDTGYQHRHRQGTRDMRRNRPTPASPNGYHRPQTFYNPTGPTRERAAGAPQKIPHNIPYTIGDYFFTSRLGLDVSRFAFGSILREYHLSQGNPVAMHRALDRFLKFDSVTRRPISQFIPNYKGTRTVTPIMRFFSRFFSFPLRPTQTNRTDAAIYLDFVSQLCFVGDVVAKHMIEALGGTVHPDPVEVRWTVDANGWIQYHGRPAFRNDRRAGPWETHKPIFPTSPPAVIRANRSQNWVSPCNETTPQPYYLGSGYSSVAAQAAPTFSRYPQTPPIPQYNDWSYSHNEQPANRPWGDDIWSENPHENLQRKRKRDTTPGQEEATQPDDGPPKKKQKSTDLIITQLDYPEVVFGDHSVPSTDAAMVRAEDVGHEYSMNPTGRPDTVPVAPSKKKRKRTDGVKARRTKKVDNGATGGSPLTVNGDTFGQSYQDMDLVLVPNDTPAAPPPVDTSVPWTPPVPTTIEEAQVLEPAPVSRFTSGVMSGKKERSSVWHVWAESRQELCESTEYFRSYQSGIYSRSTRHNKQSQLMGYLLDGFPTFGDCWIDGGLMFISHGGGARAREGKAVNLKKKHAKCPTRIVPVRTVTMPRNTLDPTPPNAAPSSGAPSKPRSKDAMYIGRDQTPDDVGVRSLKNACENRTRFVVIVGKKYAPFLWSPGYRPRPHPRGWPGPKDGDDSDDDDDDKGSYAVLGWYRVRSYWCEYEPGRPDMDGVRLFVRWKFLFEWVAEQGVPWWLRKSPVRVNVHTTVPVGGAEDLPANLQEPVTVTQSMSAPVIQRCSECDEESPQVYAQGWFCTNWRCHQVSMLLDGRLSTEVTLSYAASFLGAKASPADRGFGLVSEDLSVIPSTSHLKSLKAYTSAYWKGMCCHQCGKLSCRTKWEFWECSQCHVPLNPEVRRLKIYPARKFIPKPPRKDSWFGCALDDTVVRQIFGRWMHADIYSLGLAGRVYHIYTVPDNSEEPSPPNAIEYDPDAMFQEYQVSANAGGMFRRFAFQRDFLVGVMLPRHYVHNAGAHYKFSVNVEGSTTSFNDSPRVVTTARDILASICKEFLSRDVPFNEVLSCAYKEEQRMGFHSDGEPGVQGTIASISLGSTARMSFRPRKSRECKKAKINEKVVLGLELYHGDFVIMDGADIQKLYEHEVVPRGFRFAATARHII